MFFCFSFSSLGGATVRVDGVDGAMAAARRTTRARWAPTPSVARFSGVRSVGVRFYTAPVARLRS